MQLLGILASLFDLAVLGATFRSEPGCDPALVPGWGKARLQGKKALWRPASGRTIPWSDCTTTLAPQMSKATGWDCYLGASGRNSVCQDPGACCCEPPPASPSPSDSRRSSLTDVLTVPCGMSLEWRPLRSSPHMGEAVHLTQALCFPWRKSRLWVWCCTSLEGSRRVGVESSSYPANAACAGSLVRRVPQPPTCPRIASVVVCHMASCQLLSLWRNEVRNDLCHHLGDPEI